MGQHTQTLTAERSIDLGHQEVQRMIDEIEVVYTSAQTEWLQAEPVATFLCMNLGYEDVPELEDALNGTFEDFLKLLPSVELATRPDAEGHPALYFKVTPEPAEADWVSKRLTYRVTQRAQLWNVLLKSPYARIEIPALGLEISADGRKRIDTVWNFLSSAALDLGMHIQTNKGMNDGDTDKTVEVIEGLAALRDVDYPWDMVIIDPSGISHFVDSTLVETDVNHVDTGRMVDEE
ncbi:hypothetical protein H9P43_003912 [Blastocladiella emersonii ATCC 22665]|nr:hypothetical protein H9P43_003912 [Blastocladiella emersonii ATCC 22665]